MDFQVKRKGVREDKKDIEVTEEAFAIIEVVKDLTNSIKDLKEQVRLMRFR